MFAFLYLQSKLPAVLDSLVELLAIHIRLVLNCVIFFIKLSHKIN